MRETMTWGMSKALGAGLVLVAVVHTGGAARAEDCGNIAESGVCQDPKTLVYCARGELKTMVCASDEICVEHEFFGDGNSGCVDTRYAGCGDITEAGRCVGDTLLLYCENNRVAERVCGDGWTCGLVEGTAAGGSGEDYFDCVRAGAPSYVDSGEAEPTPPVESDIEDDDDVVEEEPSMAEPVAGPSVERGGAPAAGEYTAGGDGTCAGGLGAQGLVMLVLGAVGLALTGARRRTARSR